MVIAIYLCVILSSVTQSAGAKLFNRHSSDTMLFNAVKALSALLLFALMAAFGFTLHLPTVLYGALYGVCLSLSMFSGYKALCLGPMALSSMLCSFSVILPLLWGLVVWDEALKPLQIAALFLLFFAIVLINVGKRAQPREEKGNHALWLLFVGATFLCNGLCSILQKQHQSVYPGLYSREFMLFAMILCSLAFSLLALLGGGARRFRQTRGKRYGVIAGVANGLASLFTLILAGFENASVLFPLISAGTILGALVCGRVLFHEKLRVNHYLALILGIFAAVLLKL